MYFSVYGKALFFAVLAFYFFNTVSSPEVWHLINGVNLLMHEGGHVLTIPFGQFLYIAGGSFFQVFIPCIFLYYFFVRDDFFSSSIMLLWVGQSITNVGIYAKDAIDMDLPLVGGDGTIHDWNYLLTHTGLLTCAESIGKGIISLGVIVMISGIVLFLVWYQQVVKESLK